MPAISSNYGNGVNAVVKFEGAELEPSLYSNLMEIVVDMSLDGPDMITLRFDDFNLEILETGRLIGLGKEVEVRLGYGSTSEYVTKGEIVSIEPTFASTGYNVTTVRALHKMNRLFRGRKTRTFKEVTDSDIASSIVGETGMTASVESTTEKHDYVVQWNQTDMEFLQERARRNGYTIWADQNAINFKADKNVGSAVLSLNLGVDLISFRPRITLGQQVTKVEAYGWNFKDKQAVVGTGTTSENIDQGGLGKLGNSAQSATVGETPYAVIDHAVKTQSEANVIAKAKLKELNRAFIEGEAEFVGSTLIKPGVLIEIAHAGRMFNGLYMVSYVQHRVVDGAYTTMAGISTANSDRVGRLLNGVPEPQVVNGVLPAVVTSLADPLEKNRVQVKFPWMPKKNGVDLTSDWLRIAAPMAGNARGILFMPEVGDEVLVAFEGGNPTRGYILGGLWNGQDAAPYNTAAATGDGKTKKRTIKTTSGHELLFNDESGSESITLTDKAGNKMFFDSANKLIKFTAVKDFVLDAQGDITVKATGKIAMESTGTFGIKATGALSMESTAAASLKGASISIQGQSTVSVQANASLSLSSSGIAELKGSLVKIN